MMLTIDHKKVSTAAAHGCQPTTNENVGVLLHDLLRLSEPPTSSDSSAAVAANITHPTVVIDDRFRGLSFITGPFSRERSPAGYRLVWWWLTQFLTHTLPHAFVNLRSLGLVIRQSTKSSYSPFGNINEALAAAIVGLGSLESLSLMLPLICAAATEREKKDEHSQLRFFTQGLQHHPTLTKVKLTQCTDSSRVDDIVDARSTVTQLERLDIHCCFSSSASSTCASNRSRLKGQEGTGHANFSSNNNQEKGTILSPQTLKKLITSCTRLKNLSLWHCHLSDAHSEALLAAKPMVGPGARLRDYSGLQLVSFRFNPSISVTAWIHFYKTVVPHQYTLTFFAIRPVNHFRCSKLEYNAAVATAKLYLVLNCMGRSSVLQMQERQPPLPQQCYNHFVVEFLRRIRNSPSEIFAMLSSKPTLVLQYQGL
jgi:hypothetical protein